MYSTGIPDLVPILDVLIQFVIVEQSIQLSQHRIDLCRQLGHPSEHFFSCILVDQHRLASLPPSGGFISSSSIPRADPLLLTSQPTFLLIC
jgi:hypothetical protein